MERRSILMRAGLVPLFCAAGSSVWAQQVPLPGKSIPQFVDPLPLLDVAGGPIRTVIAGASEIEMHMREFQARVMPTTFVAAGGAYTGTWVWGYTVGSAPPTSAQGTYTGPVVVATRNVPTQFRFVNDLGFASATNVLAWKFATDQTLHWADPFNDEANDCAHMALENPGVPPIPGCDLNYDGPIPAVVHLHGGDVPPQLDGGPDAWFTSDGLYHGHAYYTKRGGHAAGNEAVYRYPNGQEAAPIWFHDHALGITRLNVYAGLAGGYAIIDPNLVLPTGLHPVGLQQGAGGAVDFLVPLVIQDRMFDVSGQWYFPNEGINPEHPFWIPEFVGDTILVNGKVWPYMNVEPRRYRFLVINGSNARPYELFLYNPATLVMGPPIWQIGTDGGYLDAPVKIDPNLLSTAGAAPSNKLTVMPGERADIIIDFGGLAPGTTLLLRNSAKTPYPAGETVDPLTTGRIVQFRVVAGSGAIDNSYNPALGGVIRSGAQKIVRLVDPAMGTVAPGVVVSQTRQLTLNEVVGPGGPTEILVNNTLWGGTDRPDFTAVSVGGNTTYYSELPAEGTTEVWEIVNLTADAHPIHTHLTQVQVLNRQAFSLSRYNQTYEGAFPGGAYVAGYGPPLDYNFGNPLALGGNPDVTPFLQGKPIVPNPNERGWKDTVQMFPGQVTRIVVRYTPQDKALNAPDLYYPFDPNGGNGYVWHCHIIDHEDNEMMRPYVVIPNPAAKRTYIKGKDY